MSASALPQIAAVNYRAVFGGPGNIASRQFRPDVDGARFESATAGKHNAPMDSHTLAANGRTRESPETTQVEQLGLNWHEQSNFAPSLSHLELFRRLSSPFVPNRSLLGPQGC